MITVVIPTYNRLPTLCAVLESFGDQTLSPSQYEILVVDSLSDDGTEAYLQQFKPAYSFRYIRQENRGRPGARNRGIREALGEIILFTDADIVPDPGFLEQHQAFHHEHRKAAAVGWESRVNSLEEISTARRNPETRFRLHPSRRKKLSWLYFLTGNASVRREDLFQAGLFDEAFQGYGFEDLELGYRLSQLGVEIHYLPKAVSYHVHPRSLEGRFEVQRLAGKNAVYFYRKHGDWRIRWLLGMSPAAFFWHRLVETTPYALRLLERMARRIPLAREILVQYHYLLGVRDAWK